MNGEMILENLDSLWFFSNILSPSSLPIPCNHGNTRKLEIDFTEPPNPPEQQTPTSISAQPLDTHTVDILNTLKAAELGTDLEAQVQTLKPEIEVHPEIPKKSRATRNKQKKHQKKTVDVEMVEELVLLGLSLHQISEKQRMRTRRSLHCCSMPPLSDGLAMKEHLKSWAYAVACTVR